MSVRLCLHLRVSLGVRSACVSVQHCLESRVFISVRSACVFCAALLVVKSVYLCVRSACVSVQLACSQECL